MDCVPKCSGIDVTVLISRKTGEKYLLAVFTIRRIITITLTNRSTTTPIETIVCMIDEEINWLVAGKL